MSAQLEHFSPDELRLNQQQALRVLKFFFPSTNLDPGTLTDEDRSFAQALLVEAINASAEMGYIKILFDKMYTPPADFGFIKDIVKDMVKYGARTWYRHLRGKDFSDPQIYLTVRNQLSLNFRDVWQIRLLTGELTY